MGTRHLITVFHDGKYQLAQYGQWDGYPSVKGAAVLDFLKTRFNREKLLAGLTLSFVPTGEQIDAWFKQAEKAKQEWSVAQPTLSRDTSGEILDLVQNATAPYPLTNQIGFAAVGWSCEWLYVVDLDTNRFEVFTKNSAPLAENERFKNILALPGVADPDLELDADDHPVKFVAAWPLDALPELDDFVKKCDPTSVKPAA